MNSVRCGKLQCSGSSEDGVDGLRHRSKRTGI